MGIPLKGRKKKAKKASGKPWSQKWKRKVNGADKWHMTIYVPKDLHQEFKVEAAKHGMTLSDFMVHSACELLDAEG